MIGMRLHVHAAPTEVKMDTIVYTHGDFIRDVGLIAEKIKSSQNKYELLVGINRGGCLPAVCLSHTLKIPTSMIDYSTRDGVNIFPYSLSEYFWQLSSKYEYRKILIVDDLVDSGKAMQTILKAAKPFLHADAATLLWNNQVTLPNTHYWGTEFNRSLEKRYFDFWWEII